MRHVATLSTLLLVLATTYAQIIPIQFRLQDDQFQGMPEPMVTIQRTQVRELPNGATVVRVERNRSSFRQSMNPFEEFDRLRDSMVRDAFAPPQPIRRETEDDEMNGSAFLNLLAPLMRNVMDSVMDQTATPEHRRPRGHPCAADLHALCPNVDGGLGNVLSCLSRNAESLTPRCARFYQRKATGEGVVSNCRSDIESLCASVRPGRGRIVQCLRENAEAISHSCAARLGLAVPDDAEVPAAEEPRLPQEQEQGDVSMERSEPLGDVSIEQSEPIGSGIVIDDNGQIVFREAEPRVEVEDSEPIIVVDDERSVEELPAPRIGVPHSQKEGNHRHKRHFHVPVILGLIASVGLVAVLATVIFGFIRRRRMSTGANIIMRAPNAASQPILSTSEVQNVVATGHYAPPQYSQIP